MVLHSANFTASPWRSCTDVDNKFHKGYASRFKLPKSGTMDMRLLRESEADATACADTAKKSTQLGQGEAECGAYDGAVEGAVQREE